MHNTVIDVHGALAGSLLEQSDAELLLAQALRQPRSWILAHPEHRLSDEEWTLFTDFVERRRRCEPVAYVVQEQEFYGRPFFVDRRVLIPRPSTEGIVRSVLAFTEGAGDFVEEVDEKIVVVCRRLREPVRPGAIVDIGTGSGCIAVTLALELPHMRIIATDVSGDALDVARMNAERHRVSTHIEFRQGRGLAPVADLTELFLLVSNPPYIPSGKKLMRDVEGYEPHVALFGGDEGSEVMREIIEGAMGHPLCVGYVIECEENQITELQDHL